MKPIAVFIPKAEREALLDGGVVPSAWFCDVLSGEWNGDGKGIGLWSGEYAAVFNGADGKPPHPARLLGLGISNADALEHERTVARFFGSHILHVVFLDGGGGTGSSPTMADDCRVGVDPIMEAARWARNFNRSIEYWFASEQVRNISHSVLVIARSGIVSLSQEQANELNAEFSDAGTLKTCYLVDVRSETESGNDPLLGKYLWPIHAGRLLLRLVIALRDGNHDDVFLPGVHLWRYFEFLFDYPKTEMTDMVKSALSQAYKKLSEKLDASVGMEAAAKNIRTKIVNEETQVFPGLSTSLSEYGVKPLPEIDDWYKYENVSSICGDGTRWRECLDRAREDFALREAQIFRDGNPAMVDFSTRGVFQSVAEDPQAVAVELKRLNENRPSDTNGESAIYRLWKSVVDAEKERQDKIRELRKAGLELALTQAHYVTMPYGMCVSLAVSLLSGLAVPWVVLSLGGSGAILLALYCASLSVVGAFAAWGIVAHLHGQAGRRATEEFYKKAQDVDGKMDARHAALVAVVRVAELRHRKSLQIGAWMALQRLLARIKRILKVELESPTLSAFYRKNEVEKPVANKVGANSGPGDGIENQRKRFLELTRFAERVGASALEPGRRVNSDDVIATMLDGDDEDSFKGLWKRICSLHDKHCNGNLPAVVLIPAIREWLTKFCDKLCAAQKRDIIEMRGQGRDVPDVISRVAMDSDFELATMHVDNDGTIKSDTSRVFCFEGKVGKVTLSAVEGMLQGATKRIPVTTSPVLDGLAQVAVFFQDIRLYGLKSDEDGRLAFLTKVQYEEFAKGGHQ